MAFRREVLLDLGGFDPVFGPGAPLRACEDLDLAGRASATGWTGQYQPGAVVSHHHGRKAHDLPALLKSYGIGTGAYHMKLLLNGGEVRCFAESLGQVARRLRASRISVLWEPLGALKYSRIYLTDVLRRTSFKFQRTLLLSSTHCKVSRTYLVSGLMSISTLGVPELPSIPLILFKHDDFESRVEDRSPSREERCRSD